MFWYILFITVCCCLAIWQDNKPNLSTWGKISFWVLCSYLIILSGCSYRLGCDKSVYLYQFEHLNIGASIWTYCKTQYLHDGYMPLWNILVYAVKKYSDCFYYVQFFQSLIVNIGVCYIGYHYCKRHFLFLLLYFVSGIFFHFTTDIMREGIAIGIGLIAIYQYFNKRTILYAFLVVIAVLFHISALMLLLVPLCKFRVNSKYLIVCLSVSLLFFICKNTFLSSIFNWIPEPFYSKIVFYLGTPITFLGLVQLLIRYIILPYIVGVFCINMEPEWDKDAHINQLLAFQLLVGVIICCGGFAFTRLQNYFRIFYLLWISEFILLLFTQKPLVTLRVFSCGLLILFLTLQLTTPLPQVGAHFYNCYIPYTTEQSNPDIFRTRIGIYYIYNHTE